MLMEHSPDFEAYFYNGTKFSLSKDGTKITNNDGSCLLLDSNSRSTCLSPETQNMFDLVNKVIKKKHLYKYQFMLHFY